MTNQIHEMVRDHYAKAALEVLDQDITCGGACCGDACCGATAGVAFYSDLERADLPDAAVLASLGCGNPIAVADLNPGERVLDLGSGGGIDVLLSAKRVGPTGRAFGLDMTDEMLALAQRNAAAASATNVEFLKGHIEAIPLPAASIDVVISNCVINLAGVASARGRHERAAYLLGAGDGLLAAAGMELNPGTAIEYRRHRATCTAALGEEQFRRRYDAGRALTRERAMEAARER